MTLSDLRKLHKKLSEAAAKEFPHGPKGVRLLLGGIRWSLCPRCWELAVPNGQRAECIACTRYEPADPEVPT